MLVLHVALYALRAELATIEGKVFPGLEADNFVVAHAQLNSALLAAEATMRLDQLFVLAGVSPATWRNRVQGRAELIHQLRNIDGKLRHSYNSFPIPRTSMPRDFHRPSCASARFLRRQAGQTS